jgi:hypothetical protein
MAAGAVRMDGEVLAVEAAGHAARISSRADSAHACVEDPRWFAALKAHTDQAVYDSLAREAAGNRASHWVAPR